MEKEEDLTGRQFDRWCVQDTYRIRKGQKEWLCKCQCGTERYVNENNLLSGKTHSCGCLSVERAKNSAKDLTNMSFGLLTARRRVENRHGRTCWECDCECGNTVAVTAHELMSGKTKSCGCLRKKKAANNELIQNLQGVERNYLRVLYPIQRRSKKGSAFWHCQCTRCGKEIDLSQDQIIYGNYKSCGCLKADYSKTIYQQLHFVDDTCVELLEHRKYRSDNTSGFRGVNKRENGRFHANIGFRKKRYYLGTFDTFEEAVDARLRAEAALHQAFVDGYYKWKHKADQNPEWAKRHPYSFEDISNGNLNKSTHKERKK